MTVSTILLGTFKALLGLIIGLFLLVVLISLLEIFWSLFKLLIRSIWKTLMWWWDTVVVLTERANSFLNKVNKE